MNEYKLMVQTTTGMVPWEYNFNMASDAMAVDYAKSIAAQFNSVRWFMGMGVWRMNSAEPGDATHVVELRIKDEPHVYETT